MIIFLNGTSSAGKSSIAREVLRQSEQLLLHYSSDHLLTHWIDQKFVFQGKAKTEEQNNWFFLKQIQDSEGQQLATIADGAHAIQLHQDIIATIGLLAHKGYSIVLDEIIWHGDIFQGYLRELMPIQPVYLVKVSCCLGECERREFERNDRLPGLARGVAAQIGAIIPFYDLEIDTTHSRPEESAATIFAYIEKHPHPKAFQTIAQI